MDDVKTILPIDGGIVSADFTSVARHFGLYSTIVTALLILAFWLASLNPDVE